MAKTTASQHPGHVLVMSSPRGKPKREIRYFVSADTAARGAVEDVLHPTATAGWAVDTLTLLTDGSVPAADISDLLVGLHAKVQRARAGQPTRKAVLAAVRPISKALAADIIKATGMPA